MLLQNKSQQQTNIIGISLLDSFIKSAEGALRTFYDANEEKAYATLNKILFQEQASETDQGLIYNQSVKISFPNSDLHRSERITAYMAAKAVKLHLCNGAIAYIGINDYFQNTKVNCELTASHKETTITYSTVSLTSVGFTLLEGLPIEIPVDFE